MTKPDYFGDFSTNKSRKQHDEEIKAQNEPESYSSLNELKLRLKVYIIPRWPEAC